MKNEIEQIDYSQFGKTEIKPLSDASKFIGAVMAKSWPELPLVTHFEEADVTELESFRKNLNARPGVGKGELPKITILSFVVTALVKALKDHPEVNSSLSSDKASLILKKYYNIALPVDTSSGLFVAVVKNADSLSVDEIASTIIDQAAQAHAGTLDSSQMACMSCVISSLGNVGGVNFTPLTVDGAMVGLSRISMKPVWNGKEFVPRLILPFSISYDHRILDGGPVARFGLTLASYLSDLPNTLA